MKAVIQFKMGIATIATIHGEHELRPEQLTLSDAEHLVDTEGFLEKLTGYRVHINLVEEDQNG